MILGKLQPLSSSRSKIFLMKYLLELNNFRRILFRLFYTYRARVRLREYCKESYLQKLKESTCSMFQLFKRGVEAQTNNM